MATASKETVGPGTPWLDSVLHGMVLRRHTTVVSCALGAGKRILEPPFLSGVAESTADTE